MDTPIWGVGSNSNLSATSTVYGALCRLYGLATSMDYYVVVPCSGTFSNLRVRVGSAPGTNKSFAFTVLKNGVATALTCTISGSNTTASDLTHSFTVAAGDLLYIKIVPTGTPTSSLPYVSLLFTNSDGLSPLLSSVYGANFNATTQRYHPLMCDNSGGAANVTISSVVIPTNGTISNLFVNLSTAPGAGKYWDFKVYKNGSSTAITTRISDTAKVGNDTTHSISVSAGDIVCVSSIPNSTPSGSTGAFGLTFKPDTDGESIHTMTDAGAYSPQANTFYLAAEGGKWTQKTTEIQFCAITKDLVLKKLYTKVYAAPGAGNSETFTARKNGADQSLTCQIADAATSANDTVNTVSYSEGDDLQIKVVNSATLSSANTYPAFSLVAYIQPPQTNNSFTMPKTVLTTTKKTPSFTRYNSNFIRMTKAVLSSSVNPVHFQKADSNFFRLVKSNKLFTANAPDFTAPNNHFSRLSSVSLPAVIKSLGFTKTATVFCKLPLAVITETKNPATFRKQDNHFFNVPKQEFTQESNRLSFTSTQIHFFRLVAATIQAIKNPVAFRTTENRRFRIPKTALSSIVKKLKFRKTIDIHDPDITVKASLREFKMDSGYRTFKHQATRRIFKI